jgi:hypothetical protein
MSKYSFDLMILNDDDFRGKLHNAFASVHDDLKSGALTADDHGSTMDALQTGIRDKYNMSEGDIGRLYKGWQDSNSSFSYIDKNAWDANVQTSEDFGYDWLMGLSDEQMMEYAVANPELKKKYKLTNPDEQFEQLVRGQHAAAASAGNLTKNTSFFAGVFNQMPSGSPIRLDPELETAINFVKGSSDSLANQLDELRRSGLLPSESESKLRALAAEQSKEYNINTGAEALESLRYIDSEPELADYYHISKQAGRK